ncbi:MAG TPA: helix-turn-helix domain-containing protein, partial [Geothrix sp.]|nr:helix-turn-helix domain-containing protein [Geothrix sp.]
GTFRQDLYYRLNVSMIKLPPLREHPEDIPELLEAFLHKFAARKGVARLRIDPGVSGALQGYAWPGNVREFQNVVERMIHAVRGPALLPEDIPDEILRPPDPSAPASVPAAPGPVRASGSASLREQLQEEEREQIQASLRAWKGNMSQAARELGMARNTLYRKVQKLGI